MTPCRRSLYSAGLVFCILLILFGCDSSPVTTSGEGCDALLTPCPEGTACQLDAIGNPYCESSEIPLAGYGTGGVIGGGQEAGETAGATTIGGEQMGGEALAGQGVAGLEIGGEVTGGESFAGEQLGGGERFECGSFMLALKPSITSIPRVMLVVDRSYSMIDPEDRWTPALTALTTVTQNLEADVAFGLTLFPDPTSITRNQALLNQCTGWGRNPYACEEDVDACAPGRVIVEPAVNQAMMISQSLAQLGPEPDQATPTRSAILAAAQSLLQSDPTSNGERVIILVTDGLPGCNFGINPNSCDCLVTGFPLSCEIDAFASMCLDEDETVREVERLNGLGIKTVVVGLTIGLPSEDACINGDECRYGGQACVNGTCRNLAPEVLSAISRAGGDPRGTYFSASDLTNIEAQITSATGSVAPCVFNIEEIPVNFYDRLAVYIDGEVIPNDPNRTNGWIADRGVLEFFGPACESLRDGNSHRIGARCE